MNTCSRCGQEVRLGWRHGRKSYWHREDVDHETVFGYIMTPEDWAEIERQLDLPRTRIDKDGNEVTYTTREFDFDRMKKAAREAAEAEEPEIEHHPIPPPEIYATPIESGDSRMPGGAKTMINTATKLGWRAWATYSRGPRTHATLGTLLGTSDFVVVRMVLDGTPSRAVGSWRDNKFDFAYTVTVDNETYRAERVNSDGLKFWIKGEEPT